MCFAVVCLWGVFTANPKKNKKLIVWCLPYFTLSKMCMQDIQIVKSDEYCLKVNWIFVPGWDKQHLMSLNVLAVSHVNKTSLWFFIIPLPFPSHNTSPLEPHSYCFSCWTFPFQNTTVYYFHQYFWPHDQFMRRLNWVTNKDLKPEKECMNKLQSRGIKISWKLVAWIMNLRPNVSAWIF